MVEAPNSWVVEADVADLRPSGHLPRNQNVPARHLRVLVNFRQRLVQQADVAPVGRILEPSDVQHKRQAALPIVAPYRTVMAASGLLHLLARVVEGEDEALPASRTQNTLSEGLEAGSFE